MKNKDSFIVSITPIVFVRSWQLTWILAGTMLINAIIKSVSRLNNFTSIIISLSVNYLVHLLSKPFLKNFFSNQARSDKITIQYVEGMVTFAVASLVSLITTGLLGIKLTASDFHPLDQVFGYTGLICLLSMALFTIFSIKRH